jgi:hypothetical protein
MRLCTLDLSKARTGWSVWHTGWDQPRYGSWPLGGEYTTDGEVYLNLHRELDALKRVMGFDIIAKEQAINPGHLQGFTNIRSIELAFGLSAHVHSFGFSRDCRVVDIHIDTWRIDFVGSGEIAQIRAAVRAKAKARGKKMSARDDLKEATMARCRQLGLKPENDDEGDAIGVGDYFLGAQGIIPPWRANEVLRAPLVVGR